MWKNIKIRTKLLIMSGILLVGMLVVAFLSIKSMERIAQDSVAAMEKAIRDDFDEYCKGQVVNVISMISYIYEKEDLTEAQAKELCASIIRELRYKDGGYFWIDDMEGNNIVLLGNATEGTNRYNAEDADGNKYVQSLLSQAKAGGGFSDYYFPREGETQAAPKRAYSQTFEPYGWVIGTGNYTDDIDEKVAQERTVLEQEYEEIRSRIFGIVAGCMVLALLVMILTIASVAAGFRETIKGLKALGSGDFSYRFPVKYFKRRDDFGILIQETGRMETAVAGLIGEVKKQAQYIYEMVGNITESVKHLTGEIENISATTQQLAAGMEETSASSQEMAATAQTAGESSAAVADLSLNGQGDAVEIGKRAQQTKTQVVQAQEKAAKLMDGIRKELSEALENVKVMEQIGVLAETIMSITSQTNLLALNASIEAARAGEAGKGFAVVADEIGKLADQSKSTVSQIQQITGQVTAAVDNLSKSAQELLVFVSTDVHKDYEDFLQMGGRYSEDGQLIENMVTEINQGAVSLNHMMETITEIVKNVAIAAQEGAAGTSDIAQHNADIREGAEDIKDMVNKADAAVKLLEEEVAKFTVS